MNVSISRATKVAPGNGTKAMTSASAKPRARLPAVEASAISAVLTSALTKAREPSVAQAAARLSASPES